ncbi:amino acid adenylation domain-containing protein [Streptomyces sp. NPDC093970]|uniref:non-ribosomal peptide synthetase n=1 Tax=Streptomyces sp. NPDC093970 TaxID=3155076 RepID=UPI0034168445
MPDAPARPHASLPHQPGRHPSRTATGAAREGDSPDALDCPQHLSFTVRFHGDLDTVALDRACDAVLNRHQALRGVFRDGSGAPGPGSAAALLRLVVEEAGPEVPGSEVAASSDAPPGPLGRLVLRRTGPREHRLLVAVPRQVFDSRSVELFVADLAVCYRARVEGREPVLPALAEAEPPDAREARIAAALPRAERYWAEHPVTDEVTLPGADRTEPGTRPGTRTGFRMPAELRDRLAAVADRIGVSRYELLVASVHALLFRYGNTAPVTALDIDTRTPDQRDLVGAHANELPLRSEPESGLPFADFARRVGSGLRELQTVREVPLGRVRPEAEPGAEPGAAPAPVQLAYHRETPVPRFAGAEATVDRHPPAGPVRHTLQISVADGTDGLDVVLRYPADPVTENTVRSVARHWRSLLGHVANEPGTALADLPLLGREETDALLAEGCGTTVPPSARTVPELVAAQAARTPDAVAVVHAGRQLTYAQLDTAAARLADGLRRKGIGPGALVAVRASRTERLLVGLLGVLKAGAAYVPLDPEYPADRLDFITTDSRAALELTDADLVAVTEDSGEPERAVPQPPAPGDLAYVIYTSGSTGRPKGVQIEHGSLVNLLLAMRDLLGTGPGDRWLASASAAFDMSVPELYLALVTGGTVVMAGEAQVRQGAELRELIARQGITHMQATPTGWSMLLDAGFEAPGITAVTGGEAITPTLARRLRPKVGRLVNLYGPTETTVWSMADDIAAGADRVTIGLPLANTRVYVLDERLVPVPRGLEGDLYIAGAGLARGYLGRPELDRERFLPDPFGARGSRMYRTGDRVRRRDDGRLEFLGRGDDQIKLRGYRIELGEIESRLLAVPGVDQAAAAVREERLAGYFVGSADPGELRRALAASLPAYMVPDVFVALGSLPATPNGKLDRSALPSPAEAVAGLPFAAEGDVLETVRHIWCEVLRIPELGDTEDLFDLGGHSLTMTQISARVLDRLGVEVPLHAYFESPTVAGLAAVVAELLARE